MYPGQPRLFLLVGALIFYVMATKIVFECISGESNLTCVLDCKDGIYLIIEFMDGPSCWVTLDKTTSNNLLAALKSEISKLP